MRTKGELTEMLWEHYRWLVTSAQRFDEGDHSEAKRMAHAIRTLVHTTTSSTSLLTQLEVRDTMSWYSSIEMPGTTGVWGDDPGYGVLTEFPYRYGFDTWWNEPVYSFEEEVLSRRYLVVTYANLDGGSHVDPHRPDEYKRITREGAFKPVRINSAGNPYPDTSNPMPSALRTICSEVGLSLREL